MCQLKPYLQYPINLVKIKVAIDPHDHTNYYAHSPGGHFGHGHFSPGVPHFFLLGLIWLKIRRKRSFLAVLGQNRLWLTASGKLFLFSHPLETCKSFSL